MTMRPLRLRLTDKPIRLPGLFQSGEGFVRRTGQIKVDPTAPCSREIVALHRALGIADRPSLYLGVA